MTATLSAGTDLTDFVRHLRLSGPFESNRVNDASAKLPPNVPAIHAEAYEDLAFLIRQVHNRALKHPSAGGKGAVLWGEAGVGKSHLLARLWHELRHDACVASLHNVQASPERLPSYVLKCVVGQLARCSDGTLLNGELNLLLNSAVKRALGSAPARSLESVRSAFRETFVNSLDAPNQPDVELVFEFLFAYFWAVFRGELDGDPNPPAATLALRWLTGDALDQDEVAAVGLPEKFQGADGLVVEDDQAIETVLWALARLACDAGRTFVVLFDQADNLKEEQFGAWASAAQVWIDHIPNSLVVTSGVQGRLLQMKESPCVLEASWDRIAEKPVQLSRIAAEEAKKVLSARLDSFIEQYLDHPEIREQVEEDSLFPLGSAWLEDRLGGLAEVRPRDVISWARDRCGQIAREIKANGAAKWLADWPGQLLSNTIAEALPPAADRRQQIDEKVTAKLAEQCHRRALNPESLPADASNLLGLVEQLLAQCIDTEHDYSLNQVSRAKPPKSGAKPTYDLIVEEQTPGHEVATTGIKFLATGSKSAMSYWLGKLAGDDQPPQHTLIVTDERCPLKLGPKGREYLAELEARGSTAFGLRELSIDDHVQLDALQAVVGLACSGDLEVAENVDGPTSVDAAEVIDAHHRADRYREHNFLRELLTEEPRKPTAQSSTPIERPAAVDELKPFIMSQIALTSGMSTPELADKFTADTGLGVDKNAAVLKQMEQAVVELHQAGRISATPQDDHTLVSLSEPRPAVRDDDLALLEQVTPVRFTVTQVRQAAACARLLHFDAEYTRAQKLKRPRVTQIWQTSDSSEVGALGTLFHQAVERFNDRAAKSKQVRNLLNRRPSVPQLSRELYDVISKRDVKQSSLVRALPEQRTNFLQALSRYTDELAAILAAGLARDVAVEEVLDQVFGDRRKAVDVTFEVGPDGREVNIAGRLDYVFYDWRREGRRIIDYKLTPGQSVEADLYQVCVYALMHHQQHGTKPDVGLLYLHPERQMHEMSWDDVYARRREIYDLLASMVEWQNFQAEPARGLHPPGNEAYCSTCRYAKTCESKLGGVDLGETHTHWQKSAKNDDAAEPVVKRSAAPEQTAAGLAATNAIDAASDAVDSLLAEDATTTSTGAEPSSAHPEDESKRELLLGETEAGDAARYPVDTLRTHVALVGAAGSGKTWMAKVIAEEAIRQGMPVIAIDPQGDLVQFIRQTNQSLGNSQAAHNEYWQGVEPRIYTPGSLHGTQLCIDPIRLPAKGDLQRFNDQEREVEREALLAATATNLVNLAEAGGNAAMQQTFVMKLIEALMAAQPDNAPSLTLKNLASAVLAPDAVGMEDADMFLPKRQRTKLGQMIMTLLHGPRKRLFHGGESLNIDAFCQPTEKGKTPLNVVYLNALVSQEEKQFFVAALATELCRWMTTSLESTSEAKLLVYLDEARDYIPAGASKPVAKDPLIRLFSQGRKYGVSCLVCTQSPKSVDYNIFGNCSTKLIGRLESTQDVDCVAKWFGKEGGKPPWLSARKSAHPGTFVARWPGMPASLDGVAFKGRPLYSLHEGAWSPDRVEAETRQTP